MNVMRGSLQRNKRIQFRGNKTDAGGDISSEVTPRPRYSRPAAHTCARTGAHLYMIAVRHVTGKDKVGPVRVSNQHAPVTSCVGVGAPDPMHGAPRVSGRRGQCCQFSGSLFNQGGGLDLCAD